MALGRLSPVRLTLRGHGVRRAGPLTENRERRWLPFPWIRLGCQPAAPGRAGPGTDAGSGRGLLLVDAVSERWGHFAYDGGGVVWALLLGAGLSARGV
jgi:hypothetical protein